MAGPTVGVNAVEMTLAVQLEPAAALRASVTCTSPKRPLIVPPPTLFARVPRLPASAGTVIAREPPVTITVAVLPPDTSAAAEVAATAVTSRAPRVTQRVEVRDVAMGGVLDVFADELERRMRYGALNQSIDMRSGGLESRRPLVARGCLCISNNAHAR
jgi:hypothetical protein